MEKAKLKFRRYVREHDDLAKAIEKVAELAETIRAYRTDLRHDFDVAYLLRAVSELEIVKYDWEQE